METTKEINELVSTVRSYLPEEDLDRLQEAIDFAREIYSGTHRISGKDYMHHALAVASILASMHLDQTTVIAGLLHGAQKYGGDLGSEKVLTERFGADVASLISGTTKITSMQFNSKLAYQAENIRKMLLAMSSDIRVLLVRLADRLHDMQSLEQLDRDKQLEFANETMDLYAPLASRLGIDWIKRELEDLSFSYLYPAEHRELSERILTSMEDREAYVEEVKALLTKHLTDHGLTGFRILGRPKHLFSIYRKLLAQNIPLEKVYDKVAFRIILHDLKECYEALGIIHSLWVPIDGRFKDFISSPKSNMYQSLHTSVIGPYGEFMEVQIRTEEMDKVAQEGIAAHWAYKEKKAVTTKDAKLFKWLKQLVQSIQEIEDPGEILEAVRGELIVGEVFALTPNGEVKELPAGSTPLDFAYSIHTEVGNRCVGAKISGSIVPLKTVLQNGDVVEIITSPHQKPTRRWLTLVKTSRARNRIRQWLNQEERERSLKVGRELCERELKKQDISLKKIIKTGHLREVLKALSCNTVDDLMRKVGSGKLSVQTIANLLHPKEMEPEKTPAEVLDLKPAKTKKRGGKGGTIIVDGADDILTKISHCCLPVPGDEIVGFITAGHGISVHKTSCPNLLASDAERRIPVDWATAVTSTYSARIQIVANDKKGLLADISNAVSDDDANILNIEANTSARNMARINMVVEVNNLDHLALVLRHIQQLKSIIDAKRI